MLSKMLNKRRSLMKKVYYSKVIEAQINAEFPAVSLYCNSQDEVYDSFLEVQKILVAEGKNKIAKKYLNAIFRLVKVKKLRTTDYPVAFFLNGDSHYWTTLPFQVTRSSVVASSFHVKPLLKWTQREMGFSALHMTADSVQLYEGSMASFSLMNELNVKKITSESKKFKLITQFVHQNLMSLKVPLVVCGSLEDTQHFLDNTILANVISQTLPEPDANLKTFHRQCLQILMPYLKNKEKNILQKFFDAKAKGEVVTNLNDIALLVIQKKIKHLLVNENLHLWGELNKNNGTFSYSFNQLNSKDDDILDDLCQAVLAYGGAVTVLTKETMPGQKAACAILDTVSYSSAYKHEVVYENHI